MGRCSLSHYIHALAAERKKLSQLRSTGIEKDEK